MDHSLPSPLFDAIDHGIIVITPTFTIVGWNAWVSDRTGRRPENVLGKDYRTVLSGDTAPRLCSAVECAIKRGQTTVLSRQLNAHIIAFAPPRERGTHSAIVKPITVGGSRGCLIQISDESAAATRETLLRRHRADLKYLHMQAEIANRSKSQFLASMSHELRTPLNAILGFSDMMRGGFAGPPDEKWLDYLGHIRDAGGHLLELINDLLDLAKIEAGKMELDMAPVVPEKVCRECVTLMAQQAQRAGITLESDLGNAPAYVMADERRLKQMLLNLLSNAIKFTPEGGLVRLSTCKEMPASWVIEVADSGPGMTPEELNVAMREFAQLSSNRSRQPGTGLGLPITRSIAELHGGTFNVDTHKGQGTKVFLALPIGASITDLPLSESTAGLNSPGRVNEAG